MKNFQIILIVIFIAAAVVGLLVFSGAIPLGKDIEGGQGTVILWGTFRTESLNTLLEEFNNANPSFVVKYVQKNPQNFDQELLEALASGQGTDMFFLSDDLAFHYSNKILAIPYQNYPLSSFKKNFAQAGEVFLTSKGILAFPMTIDPLVMYYNRSMLDANGIVSPPDNWDDFIGVVPTLTQRDERNKIIKSAVAFGHFSNISHAKNVLATLFMQSGNKIVSEKEGRFVSDLMVLRSSYSLSSILKFYTDFADPQKNIYSWNKSLPFSRDFFSTDKLAFYFGYASELSSLISKNPNQNFLVAEIPQIQNANFKLTSAKVTGLAISAFSKNANTAFIVANKMSSGDFVFKLAKNLKVVPARRDLLAIKQTDAYFPTFYSSALYAKGWLDPSSKDTDDIFRKMINGVSSNNLDVRSAISDASAKLSLLLNR